MADVSLIIAHRGSSGTLPENTVPAFALAVEQRADFVEVDIWRSADNELVIMHDRTLDRTTNAAAVFPDRIPWTIDDFTAAELHMLDAGGGEPIPTLTEVMDAVGPKTGLLAELKSPSRYPGLGNQLVDVFAALPNPVVVQSFDIGWMREFRGSAPELTFGLLYGVEPTDDELAEVRAWAQQINVDHRVATRELVDRIHALGMTTSIWTVDDPERASELATWGVDGIITNHPAEIRAAVTEKHP